MVSGPKMFSGGLSNVTRQYAGDCSVRRTCEAAVCSVMAGSSRLACVVMPPTRFRTVTVDGLSLFYREAGPPDAPSVLLLHGFPSSSRMWQPLIDRLADRYRLVAPDYPGFGHSDAPAADEL